MLNGSWSKAEEIENDSNHKFREIEKTAKAVRRRGRMDETKVKKTRGSTAQLQYSYICNFQTSRLENPSDFSKFKTWINRNANISRNKGVMRY